MGINRRRVVVTGIGVITSNAIGVKNFWQANLSANVKITPIDIFDCSQFNSKIAAIVKDFNPNLFLAPEIVRKTDRFVHFALAATRMAIDDANINIAFLDANKIGVIMGSGLGGMLFHEEQIVNGYQKGIDRLSPLCVTKITPNAISGQIAIAHKITGPNITISTACSSSSHAIGNALRHIQYGDIDIAITGGAEAPLTKFNFGAYDAMRVLSCNNNDPISASRPFDKNRDGFVMGEGSAVLILEEMHHALARNARIYAEVSGYAATCGAHHMVIPKEDGTDAARTMAMAIEDGNIRLNDIDYINAHGTSTIHNDKTETLAIKYLFGNHSKKIPISSTKSMVGHTLGAAGAIGAAATSLALHHQVVPPTANYRDHDEYCDLDYVPNIARSAKINSALLNSFGFGSNNSCLLIRRFYDKG